jgi:hypothetical protein
MDPGTLVPLYFTNIASKLWTPVPSYTNSFSNGTIFRGDSFASIRLPQLLV